MINVFLCLGSNLGDRRRYLQDAVALLRSRAGSVDSLSHLYESAGWGTSSVKPYLNQVVLLRSALEPHDLLGVTMEIEKELGRTRSAEKNEDRVIDIDILFYGARVIRDPDLQVPHPRLHLRKFVLVPLNEISPGLEHPELRVPVSTLLRECTDTLFVNTFA